MPMTRTDFLKEFAEILCIDPAELNPETELRALEGWDSVAYLSTVVLIDDRLGIALRPEVLRAWVTVADALAVLDSRLEG